VVRPVGWRRSANWVRFAEIGGSGTPGMVELGSFRIIGSMGWCCGAEIGFVLHNTARQVPDESG